MKSNLILGSFATVVVVSWATFAMRTNPGLEPIKVSPAAHPKYDPSQIDRMIKLHELRTSNDPGGAIGWSMLAESWLARSRESDLDTAAWKAEEFAKKSLEVRSDGNSRAKSALVESLLEQHRFQDALTTLKKFGFKTRQLADVLVELGQLGEATKVLDTLPYQNEDPSLLATRASIAVHQEKFEVAQDYLNRAILVSEANPGVSESTIAWFKTKKANVHVLQKDLRSAKVLLIEALTMNPKSYKANLALACIAAQEKDWQSVVQYAEATLKIADSLDAHALIGDAEVALGQTDDAAKTYAQCRAQYLNEVKTFDGLGKGGALHVKPIDRQFATFCVRHQMFMQEGLTAAKRDHQNRPDNLAQSNLKALENNR